MSKSKPGPCPFCGADDAKAKYYVQPPWLKAYVFCVVCKAQGPPVKISLDRYEGGVYTTVMVAIITATQEWNRSEGNQNEQNTNNN